MERFKKYLRELTVSPDYQSRGTFNPFYVLDIPEDDIRPSVGDGAIKYKNVDSGSGELIKNYGGKYHFQVNVNDEDTNYYVITTKSKVATKDPEKSNIKSNENISSSSSVKKNQKKSASTNQKPKKPVDKKTLENKANKEKLDNKSK